MLTLEKKKGLINDLSPYLKKLEKEAKWTQDSHKKEKINRRENRWNKNLTIRKDQ